MPRDDLAEEPDESLYAMAGTGRMDAFEALVGRYAGTLGGFCRRMVGVAWEEVAQETWVALWRAAPTLSGRGPFRPLLFSSARRRCLNQLRSAKSRPVEVLDTETRDPISSPQLRAVLSAQRGELLDAALAKLSPDKREAIALRIVDELSYEEMADILGENVSTLRSRVHFGLKDLRAVIRRLE